MRVLVTGANGFVGSAICAHLAQSGFSVVRGQRRFNSETTGVIDYGDLEGDVAWPGYLSGVDAIVHCAGLASCGSSETEKRRCSAINVDATLNLARAAASTGIKRFIYLSTAQVLGEQSFDSVALNDENPAAPSTYYAETKLAAERGLLEISERTDLDIVLLRPPLIYGPGLKSNLRRLMQWVDKRLMLPFGKATAPRSMIYVGNLASAVSRVLAQRGGPTGPFLICDESHLSTRDTCIRIGELLDRPARLVAVPPSLVLAVARLAGWHPQINRLFSPFLLNCEHFCRCYDWHQPYSTKEGLRHTLAWWKEQD